MNIWIPAKIHIPGRTDIVRGVTGYVGDKVAVEANGETILVDKDDVPSHIHEKLNEELRKKRK